MIWHLIFNNLFGMHLFYRRSSLHLLITLLYISFQGVEKLAVDHNTTIRM